MTTFQQIYNTITQSKVFNQFKQEHPNAKLCAGFFILDFLSNDTKKSLDYLDENSDKIFTFNLNDFNKTTMSQDKLINQESPQSKLTPINPNSENLKIEINKLKDIVSTEKSKQGINSQLHKIIAVLQNYENKLTWNLTCMLEQLIIIHVLVDAETGKIIKFERKNMMDFIKKTK